MRVVASPNDESEQFLPTTGRENTPLGIMGPLKHLKLHGNNVPTGFSDEPSIWTPFWREHLERHDRKFLRMCMDKSFLNLINLNQILIVITLFQQLVNVRLESSCGIRRNRLENISIHKDTSDMVSLCSCIRAYTCICTEIYLSF